MMLFILSLVISLGTAFSQEAKRGNPTTIGVSGSGIEVPSQNEIICYNYKTEKGSDLALCEANCGNSIIAEALGGNNTGASMSAREFCRRSNIIGKINLEDNVEIIDVSTRVSNVKGYRYAKKCKKTLSRRSRRIHETNQLVFIFMGFTDRKETAESLIKDLCTKRGWQDL